jgi:hypothetical protein
LIGGQSVAILAQRYRDAIPEIQKHEPLTSRDVDFLGSARQAKIVVSKIEGARIYVPRPFDDATPNAAQIAAKIAGHTIIVDFMSQIIWVDERKMRYLILGGHNPNDDDEIRILCLHPIDCLANRLGNINVLHREDEQAVRSAEVAVLIVDGFIDELLGERNTKDAQTCLRKLEFIVRDKCARQTSFSKFGIDPSVILKKYANDTRLDERYRRFTLGGSIERVRRYLERTA